MYSEFCMRKHLSMSGQNYFFHLKFTLSEELNQKWGFETECADSVNVAKPQIETQLKTDRSFYVTGGKGAF